MATLEEVEAMTAKSLARCMDHTVLAANHTIADVEQACEEAIGYGFAAVAVAPYDVARAARLLAGTDEAVAGTVGMPLGHSGLRAKQAEAETCVQGGAGEVDMVINLIAAKSGKFADVRDEIAAVRKITDGLVLKVILECCYLTDDEKGKACELALDGGADFVKTSTGFGRGGATPDDVALLARTIAGRAQVKASGGIRTFPQVKNLLLAGATRIGTSTPIAIIEDLRQRRGA